MQLVANLVTLCKSYAQLNAVVPKYLEIAKGVVADMSRSSNERQAALTLLSNFIARYDREARSKGATADEI